MAAAQRRIERRLEAAAPSGDRGHPMMGATRVRYEMAAKVEATIHGGMALAHRVARRSGLVAAIDKWLHLLLIHCPYHESDHVLNVAFNAMCGGRTLEDIELRRNDAAFLNAFQTESIPDPTTAGDFCRRFKEGDIHKLMSVGEQCDDGNTSPGDGCSALCAFEICGNGVLDPGEAPSKWHRIGVHSP